MRRRRILLVLAVLWVVGTLVFATRLGSSLNTQELLLPALRDLGLDELWAQRVHKGLRKLGHVLAYAGFAALAWWSLGGVRRRGAITLGVAALLAVGDEAIQAQSADRGGSILDVLLDLSAVALVLAWLRHRERVRLKAASDL